MFQRQLLTVKRLNKIKNHVHTVTPASGNSLKYADIDYSYLCNSKNVASIKENIARRKGVGDILLVNELKSKLSNLTPTDSSYETLKQQLYRESLQIPNRTHPDIYNYDGNPKVIKLKGSKKHFNFPHKEFHEIVKKLKLVRTEHLGNVSGSKSYYLLGEMAEMEQALIKYFVINLLKNNFQLISVPDVLPRNIVESCGMNTRGERTQVYTLDPNLHEPDLCLSGTSEIALAGYLTNEVFHLDDLPLKLCSISRCYRAETSSIIEERGIFRVHEFTKAEMFIASTPEQSDSILEDLRIHQEEFFTSLDLHFQVLDMPPHELGAQAYRKYDIEAWMPARNMFGEVSSCSNCTDFQSRRLNIKYKKHDGSTDYVHTLNGTACAVPRLLIALIETNQNSNGTISLPEVIQSYMGGKKFIGRQKRIPELSLVKNKK